MYGMDRTTILKRIASADTPIYYFNTSDRIQRIQGHPLPRNFHACEIAYAGPSVLHHGENQPFTRTTASSHSTYYGVLRFLFHQHTAIDYGLRAR